jgi:hypothetical protein
MKENIKQKIVELETRFAELTRELKEMDNDSPRYGQVWNKRADIKYELEAIHEENNKNI